jgi:solute carrier family 10 (sodium/bile acid cotransporter), member 7
MAVSSVIGVHHERWATDNRAVRLPRPDPFVVGILVAVAVACVLPARGAAAPVANGATDVAVGLLFFLYGARLSPREALAGLRHWRLHATVLASTFVLFPLLGLAARPLVPAVLTPTLYTGVLFLCTLPSTVQSSIAFTSIARGNVAAAICAASASSLLGVFVTPVLVGLLVHSGGTVLSPGLIGDIVLRLLVPFLLGQVLRRWIAEWVARHKKVLGLVDRGSILLVVYAAFSGAVVAGSWHQLSVGRFAELLAVDVVLLGIALLVTGRAARWLGFDRADRITIVFCGSKKSLAAGLPMASVLFAAQGAGAIGLIVLPLMLFHQIQLMVCAALARRWGRAGTDGDQPATGAASAGASATATATGATASTESLDRANSLPSAQAPGPVNTSSTNDHA